MSKETAMTTEKRPFLVYLFATFFGSGYMPLAPGTAGTLAAIPLYLLLAFFLSPFYYVIITAVLFIAGVLAADFVSKQMGGADPKMVVIDEVVGYLVVMFLFPPTFRTVILGFLVFRALDVLKPPPAYQFDRMEGGFGIMMDDVVSGIYANLSLRLILYFLR
jgi:phosphatidylglycerophosphatase A